MEIRSILVPIDFSPHSARALDDALDLAKKFGAKLHVLHAYHLPALVGMPDEIVIPPDFWMGVRDAAARKLEKTLQKVRSAGVACESHLLEGPPSQAIVQLAEKIGVDLIVMGTQGLTGLKHVLLGSVTERVLRTAPCPVLGVKARGI
jgi:nucleotide-binding universal stress UspA family protein